MAVTRGAVTNRVAVTLVREVAKCHRYDSGWVEKKTGTCCVGCGHPQNLPGSADGNVEAACAKTITNGVILPILLANCENQKCLHSLACAPVLYTLSCVSEQQHVVLRTATQAELQNRSGPTESTQVTLASNHVCYLA